jgi:hypothetical protein
MESELGYLRSNLFRRRSDFFPPRHRATRIHPLFLSSKSSSLAASASSRGRTGTRAGASVHAESSPGTAATNHAVLQSIPAASGTQSTIQLLTQSGLCPHQHLKVVWLRAHGVAHKYASATVVTGFESS